MQINYNFEENWYDIIVPLLDTPKVKNAIKRGILDYMNESLNPTVKFKSYQNIYDYLNNIHGKYYLTKNSAPSDYSSLCTEHQCEWETNLVEKLENDGMNIQFNYDETSQDNEKYRNVLEPYVKHYKKTHMDSYCLWGGCHWWNPTFGLTLAKIVMPNEKWRVRSSEYHTTIVNCGDTKIFDILYYDKDDETFGGCKAYNYSNMTLDEIRDKNIKKNNENKVNNCEDCAIYDNTFTSLTKDLEDIYKNIDTTEKTLKALFNIYKNNDYDENSDNMYELQFKIMDELFPNAKFDICIPMNELYKVFSVKKDVPLTLTQTFECGCYVNSPRPTKNYIIKYNNHMTRRYIINELIKQDFTLECDHCYLEALEVCGNILEYFTGS